MAGARQPGLPRSTSRAPKGFLQMLRPKNISLPSSADDKIRESNKWMHEESHRAATMQSDKLNQPTDRCTNMYCFCVVFK